MFSITRSVRFGPNARLVLLGVAVGSLIVPTQQGLAQEPTPREGYHWLDVDGRPLPFQDDETLREVMLAARVVNREKVGRGVAGVEKVVLEGDGLRFHAVFRDVDVTLRPTQARPGSKSTTKYRDAAIFEAAAYELSVLLGIDRVPPVVVRRIGEQSGTLQIWVEGTWPEVDLIATQALKPPDMVRWRQQKQIMYAFDSLLANGDRNQGNILIDQQWTLWFIDHTRAFQTTSRLFRQNDLSSCERSLWHALHEVDDETIRERLEPYLESKEIWKLLLRRRKLIQHIDKLIKKNGEETVIFDLRRPSENNGVQSSYGKSEVSS